MHHYGIGEIVLFSSEIELSDLWLPSLGAANITKVNGTPLDRTQTFHALATNYTPIQIRGTIDVAEDKVETNIGECMFISDTAEMCLTATKASVKAPLKPKSTVKQAAGKEGPLELELCHMPSHRARSIKVTTTRKETFCGTVPIEFCCFVPNTTPCNALHTILESSLLSHVTYLRGLLSNVKPSSQPEVRHYFNRKCFLPLNILSLEGKSLAKVFARELSIDISLTKQSQSKMGFFTPEGNLGVITNPHEILVPPTQLPVTAYTKDRYGYYHYGQQGMNDAGWGCAYRSLQTLHSWFYYQSKIDQLPPSHELIQRTLVKIGDKEKDFIGSRQWIGSFEVQFVLNELLGVTCRSINVSSGAELESKIPELIDHFESVGSPIMIGGGVLAHTIVGVAWDDATRKGKFLILDPHYTGAHTIDGIKNKGVYWRGVEFWDEKAYYNMCLPLLH